MVVSATDEHQLKTQEIEVLYCSKHYDAPPTRFGDIAWRPSIHKQMLVIFITLMPLTYFNYNVSYAYICIYQVKTLCNV